VVQNGTADPRSEYREGLAALIRAKEKLGTLHEIDTELRGTGARLQDDRERALTEANEANLDEMTRLGTRLEITRRKVSDSEVRIKEAERELSDSSATILNRFQSLWRLFRAWIIAREKTRLLEQMVSGSDGPPLDFVVLHLRRVADIVGLEITANEPGGIAEQGRKLLDAISVEPEFPVPAHTPPAVVPGEADVGLPWLDRGMSGQEIEGELKWIRGENSGLDLAGAYRELHPRHPELFGPPASNFEFERQTAWPAGMIGETREPEPEPSYVR
jgi:hypothetical protein